MKTERRMSLTNPLLFTSLMLVAGFSLEGCKQDTVDWGSGENALFRQIASDDSGIDFSNTLYESDSFNIISYEFFFNGSGVAIGDVNDDGLSDIFFGGNMVPSRLFLNKGNLSFHDVTDSAGINTSGKWVTGVNMTDVNQDGKLDIYLCVGGNINQDYRNLLYINTSDSNQVSFSEIASEAGLDDDGYSTQSAFFDYDRDGDLDMYLLSSSMKVPNKNEIRGRKNDGSAINTDRFYRNDGLDSVTGLPRFSNISNEAGIVWDGFGLGLAVCDINKDLLPDVYVANDFISDDLFYVNQGNGTFKEMFKSYFKHSSFSAMGTDVADINNDGLVDLFTLDMLPEDYYRKKTMSTNVRSVDRYLMERQAGYSPQYIRNTLQLNNGKTNGKHTFSEVGQLARVFETDWSWVPLFADFDNDGYKDLFIGNGIVRDITNMDFTSFWTNEIRKGNSGSTELEKNLRRELERKGGAKKPNVIYRNSGSLLFEDKTKAWGLDQPLYTTSAAFSDLDNDGDLDLVLNNINDPASIYENLLIHEDSKNDQAHFLEIRLVGDSLNTGGTGARINLFHSGQHQYYEHFPVRGFQSMVDPKIHFGVGAADVIDSLTVLWSDGTIQRLLHVKADQHLTLRHDESAKRTIRTYDRPRKDPLFVNATKRKGIAFRHNEREFIDYKFQPLIPHQYSKEGPGISVGDVNGDGLDDFFIGASLGFEGSVFLQQNGGSFTSMPLRVDQSYEDMGSLFFDADNDGDLDLYIVSGGAGLPGASPGYRDRLYVNDGEGQFTLAALALPDITACGSVVTAADYDRDGDLDLFVGGRVNLESYPLPARSSLLRNDSDTRGVRFTDVTTHTAKSLALPGLIASALWTDFDQDGWIDLVLAGEWMPISFFRNNEGRFTNVTLQTGLEKYTGLWNSLCGADFDKDGDIDYVAGNLGLNTPYQVSQDRPMQLVAKDFDKNGAIDPICTYYVQGKSYPMYNRDLLISQLPYLKKRFLSYDSYASATMSDIFSEAEMQDAYVLESRCHASSYIENKGDGTYAVHSLPIEAQFSSVFGLLTNDYNHDGHADLLLAGNSFDLNPETGRYDASIGLFLTGDGRGKFNAVSAQETGFFVDGDVKGMAELFSGDGSNLVLVAQNSDSLQAFSTAAEKRVLRLERDDASAEFSYQTGRIERREFYYGSGYLSQSSRICPVPNGVISVKITKYSGDVRQLSYDKLLTDLAENN